MKNAQKYGASGFLETMTLAPVYTLCYMQTREIQRPTATMLRPLSRRCAALDQGETLFLNRGLRVKNSTFSIGLHVLDT